jgi:hypothetical protein
MAIQPGSGAGRSFSIATSGGGSAGITKPLRVVRAAVTDALRLRVGVPGDTVIEHARNGDACCRIVTADPPGLIMITGI